MSEHQEQVNLFSWARIHETKHPKLKRMFAIPNGGLRNKLVAKKLKAEGVKAGVLDILLPVKTACFPGLFIEMKFGKNTLTDNQKVWKKWFEEEDFKTAVCYSWIEAVTVVVEYLDLPTELLPRG